MTARQVFEYALIELNKVQAPSILLEDFNYFINKAIVQYTNKLYNQFEINQQKVDDLRVLRATTSLVPSLSSDYSNASSYSNIYYSYLPDDYVHLLNCTVEYSILKKFNCYKVGDKFTIGAKRLTSDIWPTAIKNYYNKPSYSNPYYFLTSNTTSNNYPTSDNIVSAGVIKTAILDEVGDIVPEDTITINGVKYIFKTTPNLANELEVKCAFGATTEYSSLGYLFIKLRQSQNPNITKNTYIGSNTITGIDLTISHTCGNDLSIVETTTGIDLVDKSASVRYGNSSKVRIELRYGTDNTLLVPSKLYIDYIRSPKFIKLTYEQVDELEDNSQILEFPDYGCQEIVNELIKLLLENSSNPRLQTNIPINQSISNPIQNNR